jgi:hypothetical protein
VTRQSRGNIVGPHGTSDHDSESSGLVISKRGTPKRRDGMPACKTLCDQGTTSLAGWTQDEKAHRQ